MAGPGPRLRSKCVWSELEPEADGLRILATRYIPRGCPRARYDVWMPNLGPSERLLKEYKAGAVPWTEFCQAYSAEILGGGEVEPANPRIRNRGQKFTLRLLGHIARTQPVTLLCHCAEDEAQCHRHLLRALVLRDG